MLFLSLVTVENFQQKCQIEAKGITMATDMWWKWTTHTQKHTQSKITTNYNLLGAAIKYRVKDFWHFLSNGFAFHYEVLQIYESIDVHKHLKLSEIYKHRIIAILLLFCI